MAKLSKKALTEFDRAMEQLDGGVPPVAPPPRRGRKAAKRPKRAKVQPARKRR